MRDKCWGCGRIHDLDTACLDAAGGRIAQLEADMGSLQSHYAHEVSQRTALADELANANRRIEAHGPICLKWQYALHDADTRIRALEAALTEIASTGRVPNNSRIFDKAQYRAGYVCGFEHQADIARAALRESQTETK